MEIQNNKLEELIQTQNEILQKIIAPSANESFLALDIKNAETQIHCILNQLGSTAQSYRDTALAELGKELKQKHNDELKALEEKHRAELDHIQNENAEEVRTSYSQGCSDTTEKKNNEIEQLCIRLNNEKQKELSDLEKKCNDEKQSLNEKYETEKNNLIKDYDNEKKILVAGYEAKMKELSSDIEKELNAQFDKRLNQHIVELQNINDEKLRNELEKQKNELTKQIEEKNKAEIDKIRAEYENKIAESEEKLDEFEKQKNEFKETLKTEYEEKMAVLKEKLETATKELDTYKKSNGDLVDRFDVITEDYGKVLDQLFACKSMESYRQKNNLEPKNKGYEAIIHFIKIVGNNFTMARDIRDAMQKYRKTGERCPLMDDELKLIEVVNEFYRKEHKREDENDKVLFLPDNCNDPASKMRFNPSQMQDLDHPAETKYYSVKCIYAPCFRQYDVKGIEKAIVEASEDKV